MKRKPNTPTLKISDISRALFESAAEGLVVVDSEGIIQLVNPSLNETFGYEQNELIGEPIEILVPDNKKKSM